MRNCNNESGIFNNPWDQMLSDLAPKDISLAKKMAYCAIDFSNSILTSTLLYQQTLDAFKECIIFAKMHLYHYVTTAHTLHYLFFAYIYEYLFHHRNMPPDEAQACMRSMWETERYYMGFYTGSTTEEEQLSYLMKCFNVQLYDSKNIYYNRAISPETFSQIVGENLIKMLVNFEIPIGL